MAWSEAGVFHELWRQGLLAYDELAGIDQLGSAAPEGWRWRGRWARRRLAGEQAGRHPTDRGTLGTKRSLLTDGRGVPLSIVVDGANRNDHKLLRKTVEAIPVGCPKATPEQPQGLCLDKGCDYPKVPELAAAFGFTLHLRTRGEEIEAKRRAAAKVRRRVVV